LVGVLCLILVFTGGLALGQRYAPIPNIEPANVEPGTVTGIGEVPDYLKKSADVSLLWDTWDIVKKNYVDQPVDDHTLLYGAMSGIVAAMDDAHSIFFNPEVNENFLQELSGTFYGIGAEISIKNNLLQIVSPLPDSPAEKAGLRPGDIILKIDGIETIEMSIDYAISKIRGQKGTSVILTVFRKDETEARDITVVRDEIKIQSVKWKMLEGNIALIELRYFNSDTGKEFNKIADEIVKNNPSYIILDMRNDPGGFLEVSIDIASQFIPEGVIVSEHSFDGTTEEHVASGRAKLKEFPIIVLINEGSASASEIVAGALKDYEKAILVGKKSFGKGSVQTLFDLKDGSAIKLTIAKWFTPKGSTIEKLGISPDVEIDLTEEDFNANKDPQLDKALEIIKNGGKIPAPESPITNTQSSN